MEKIVIAIIDKCLFNDLIPHDLAYKTKPTLGSAAHLSL